VVEQNHGGQLHRYLRSMMDFRCTVTSHHRPGPLPLRPGELADAIVAWSTSAAGRSQDARPLPGRGEVPPAPRASLGEVQP
jgi:hypothetical protein